MDLRRHLLRAKEKSAKAFTLQYNLYSVLNRPDIKACLFSIDGKEKSYAINWSKITKEQYLHVNSITNRGYQLPSLREVADKTYWVNTSDFKLNSKKAYAAHEKLLADLAQIEEKDLIIFDARTNQGGNDSYGRQIVNRALSESTVKFINASYEYKLLNKNALFRASQESYDAWYKELAEQKKKQDKVTTSMRGLEKKLIKVKFALDNKQSHYWQMTPTDYSGDNLLKIITEVKKQNRFEKVVIITDKHCSSSCLNFIDYVKLIPNVLHVGEPTNADTFYKEVVSFNNKLKNTYVNLALPTKKWLKHMRDNNQPYIPDVIFEDNINQKNIDDWVLEQAHKHFNGLKLAKH